MLMKSDETLTYANDSTTRKNTGKITAAGIHVNRELCLPLPILSTTCEKTESIADGISTSFKMLEAVSDYSANEMYEQIDVHMTDSTAHNKGMFLSLDF